MIQLDMCKVFFFSIIECETIMSVKFFSDFRDYTLIGCVERSIYYSMIFLDYSFSF